MLLLLPLAILMAHGLRYILERWYGLFPENPYARIFALFPLAIFVGLILYSNLTYFTYGYRYTPTVATQFTDDLDLVRANLIDQGESYTLVVTNNTSQLAFYQILNSDTFTAVSSPSEVHTARFATLGAPLSTSTETTTENDAEAAPTLTGIITSSKSDDSARIYIYNEM